MRILRFKNVNDLAVEVERALRSLATSPSFRAFLPTGNSPRLLYNMMRENRQFWGLRLKGIQIDEFEDPRRLFWEEIQKELGKPLNVPISGWDPSWNDEQIDRHVEETLSEPIDVALLGLGPNGHVGFHEPGQKKDFMGGRVVVSEETMSRTPGAKTTKALTFGVGAFMRAKI